MTDNDYVYSTLTSAVKDKSPLREYLDSTFPNRRAINSRFKGSSGGLLAPGGDANPGTMGTAFDNAVRLRLEPDEIPFPALHGAARLMGSEGITLLSELSLLSSNSRETRARAAWAYALFIEAFRYPAVLPVALETALEHEETAAESFLELASTGVVEDLFQLEDIAETELYPRLTEPVTVGPIFQSLPIGADGDLIHDGTIIELKATLGRSARGARRDELKTEWLLQLISYGLIDWKNEFAIKSLALYSARYGHFEQWYFVELLEEMAGRPVELAEERHRVKNLIKNN